MLHIKQVKSTDGAITLLLVDQMGDEAEIGHCPPEGDVDLQKLARTGAANTLRTLAKKIEAGEVEMVPSPSWFACLNSPDNVGSAEYRAIYELLEGVESDAQRILIVEAFEDHLHEIRKIIRLDR